MLQILFMILKILGILLVVVLGILLAVLLLVLFVPLRYRFDASFDGKPGGGVLVSWLLHLVTVRVNYDGSVKALVKVLWFRLFDKTVWPAEEAENPEETEVIVPVKNTIVTEVADPVEAAESVKPAESKTEEPKSVDSVKSEKPAALIQNVITKISCTYQQICGKVDAGQKKLDLARAFLENQENRNTIHLLWKQVKKLFRHILPRKIRGRVRFGFDDPSTTGQILTYVSPFYGWYAKTLELEPVFEEKVLEGELHVKGHIRVASLFWIVIRVVLNKNFRVLLKKAKALGKK